MLNIDVKVGNLIITPVEELQGQRAGYQRASARLNYSEPIDGVGITEIWMKEVVDAARSSVIGEHADARSFVDLGEPCKVCGRQTRKYEVVGSGI